jgi:tetratricopeptide (TPR) repeat protein
MVRPFGVPDPHPAAAGRPDGAPPTPATDRVDLADLTPTELADIFWLASAIEPAPRAGSTAPRDRPERPRPEPERPTFDATELPRSAGPDTDEPRLSPAAPPEHREPAPPAPAGVPGQAPRPDLRLVPGGGIVDAEVVTPSSLAGFRALRALKREVPARRDDAVILDEEATAERAMETGQWWPVTRSGTERRLDITVVIDNSPSMALWRSRVADFISLLERVGVFRSVQVRLLDTIRHEDGSRTAVLRGGTADTPARDTGEIVDTSGRRVVLVLTDGIGEPARPGVLHPILARWGRAMPVTVVNVLPQWLWRRGGLELHRARLWPGTLRPNARWRYDLPETWLEADPATQDPDAIPIPVIELQPRWLGWWGRLVTGEHKGPAEGMVLLTTSNHRGDPIVPVERTTLDAHSTVSAFRRAASPPALRLATLLAAVPVQLDVAHVIRQHFVPEAGPEHLSELLLSGLLPPSIRENEESTWESSVLTFHAEVRELLLSGGRRSETAGVVRMAAAYFGERIPVLGHLRDAIADPDNTADPTPTRENSADVVLESAVMRALSGPYLSRADRLRNAITQELKTSPTKPESIQASAQTASNDMPDTAERADRPHDSTTGAASVRAAESEAPRHPEFEQEPVTTPLAYPPNAWSSRSFQQRQPDEPPPIWGNIPPRNPNFTGRDDLLEQLAKRLTAGGTTAVLPSALHGMGGIGKTQMATEYIYRHQADYDLIWWIEAARPTQIRAALTELARTLGLPGATEANTAVPAVREALRTGRPFRRWLLVFDAADSPEAVRPFFPNGPGEILITSRNPDWAGIARPLELAVFKREESIELLGRRGPEIDRQDADRLAEKLGDLPLAIEQAAAWRAVTGMPVREYLRLFDESVAEILDTSTPPDYEVSVAAAWNVSFDELKTRNPAAHQILHICAFFSPEPISRDLFTGVSRVSISPELDEALRDPIKLARAIRDINRYGLAKIDHGNNTLQLHRLVQLVLRNRVMAPQVQAQMRHGAHQLLASLDPYDPESSRHWPRYRELLPHAYSANIVDCNDQWVRQLVINLMRFLFQWGDHDEAAQLAERAYTHFTDKLGPTHPQTLDVAARLGLYLWGLGRFEDAAAINQRTLDLRVQVSGEDAEETYTVQANVVTDYRAKGDFAAATKLSEEIYHKSKRLFGEDDPEALSAAYQHALSLRLSGEFQAAAALDAETHKRRVEVLGPDHPKTLSTMVGLIVDRREAGEYIQARVEQEKVTDAFRQRFTEDNKEYAAYVFLLSVARRKHGDHRAALELSKDAFERFTLSYGPRHPTTMACALAHSIDLRHSGDLDAAKKLGEETFDHYREILGEHHPHTLAATVDLAVTLRLRGEVTEARVLDERALEHFRAGIGPNHPYAIIATINLASDLAALGETEPAVGLNRDALERGTQTMGTDHPTMLAAAFNLSLDLSTTGNAEEAAKYRGTALDKYRKVLGEGHPGTKAAERGVRADCDIDPMLM